MFRVLLLFSIVLHVNASELFKESRYIYAIDRVLHYEGKINFGEEKVTILYTSPKQESIIYLKEDENRQKKVLFLILDSIYNDDMDSLEGYFKVEKISSKTLLVPLGTLGDYIKNVEFKKSYKELDYLMIKMQNEDWIKIETIR